jgi:hypothetical protein
MGQHLEWGKLKEYFSVLGLVTRDSSFNEICNKEKNVSCLERDESF